MTMTHPDDETLLRSAHGELPVGERAVVEGHLASCAACRGRISRMSDDEREVLGLLRELDAPGPVVTVDGVFARAARGRRLRFRMAAGIILAVTVAGAAAAMPGSPIRRWVRETIARLSDDAPARLPAPAASQPTPAPMSGVAVAPGASFVIRVERPAGRGVVVVSLTDDSAIVARAPLGAATFTADVGRLVVTLRDSVVEVVLQIPRVAPSVEVRAGGERVFLKRGARITTGVTPDDAGRYRVP
ncbi:MAG: zf-HC2 domain-containing protein, partial [Gemmatimonadaceae bacterium]